MRALPDIRTPQQTAELAARTMWASDSASRDPIATRPAPGVSELSVPVMTLLPIVVLERMS